MEKDGFIYRVAADGKGHVHRQPVLERLKGRFQACPLRRLLGVVLLEHVLDIGAGHGSDQKMGPTLGSLTTFGILKVAMVAMLLVSSGLCRCCSLEILGLLVSARVQPEGSARRRDVMLKDGMDRDTQRYGQRGRGGEGLDIWYLSWHVGTGSRGSC
jgi:hypothetical protein